MVKKDAVKKRSEKSSYEIRKAKRVVGEAKPFVHRRNAVTDRLESIVFGEQLKSNEGSEDLDSEEEAPGALKRPPKKGGCAWIDPNMKKLRIQTQSLGKHKRSDINKKFVDGEDYESRLRKEFMERNVNVQWANEKPPESDSDSMDKDEEENECIATSMPAVVKGDSSLPPVDLLMKRFPEIVVQGSPEIAVQRVTAVQFHPSSEFLLTAGYDKTLRFYGFSSEGNEKLLSTSFEDFPIESACFTPTADKVLMVGKSEGMWGLDVASGKPHQVTPHGMGKKLFYGLSMGPSPTESTGLQSSRMYSVVYGGTQVLVLDVRTNFVVHSFEMADNAGHGASVFSPISDTLYTADKSCNIYEWDLRQGRCKARFKDNWATCITSLAINRTSTYSPTSLLAVGTETGNIDLFDVSQPQFSSKPAHTVKNLTTTVSGLAYHSSGELLAGFSKEKAMGIKLVHLGTKTVFQNWPPRKNDGYHIHALDFSKRGGMMAYGCKDGKVRIYCLSHFMKN